MRSTCFRLQGTSFYEHGLNVISWRTGAVLLPPVDYFASAPVSFPLIGLSQFTQYLVAARVSGLSPAELAARFSGASGHSQGLVTAVTMFSSKDALSFLENVATAITGAAMI
jgi:fatty acid synthase subunit alpha, fungi type